MNEAVLKKIHGWFNQYATAFYTGDAVVQQMVRLKDEHSRLVARYARDIARDLGFAAADICLAEAAGLCHDVGRFKQAVLYRTFKDRDSVDHGRLGAEELNRAAIANDVGPQEWDVIIFAVAWHNSITVPVKSDGMSNLVTRIVRDADKLDIYRILPPSPESDGCTPSLLAQAAAGRSLYYKDVKTIDDRKLVMASWVYDINFPWTLRQAVATGYLEQIWAALPRNGEVQRVRARVDSVIAAKLNSYHKK